ncbi:MAG: Fe-Mn family superoxide dismutase [Candidatus Aenigmatarchaeota archaeon]
MRYEPKIFDHLIGMQGFSETLLTNHFALYQGYVANVNKILDSLSLLVREGKSGTPEYAELKRRLGWEFNGMRLHEIYFENLSKNPKNIDKNSELCRKIEQDFGSFGEWERDFRATGSMRGIGWVVLYYDPYGKRLFNVWINEHDVGHFPGCVPVIVMDVFEHAYIIDYGLRKADYIEAFFRNLEWKVCEERFGKA